MFHRQVMFVALSSMLLLTFAYADTTSILSGTNNIGTMKTPTDFKSMMSAVIQILMKHTLGNSTGPLNVVGAINEYLMNAKKYDKEVSEQYEKMLKKKNNFEDIQKNVNQMSSVGLTNEIEQKLTEVQATASKGFQKLNEIKKMKEGVKQAIHEADIEGKENIAQFEKALLFINSIILDDESEAIKKLFSMPALIGDVFSKFSSGNTHADRVLNILNKLRKLSTEADENIDNALKGLKEVEAAQKTISEMKKSKALGVKDAHGVTTKDSTSVPSLLSNFVCFAGVMTLTVMSANYL